MGEVKDKLPITVEKMKNANLIGMFLLSVTLAAGVTGCKHRPPMTTPIPDEGGPPKTGSSGARHG